MSEAADRDLSPGEEFESLAKAYAQLAVHLLKEYTESDHLGAILLEMNSDLDGFWDLHSSSRRMMRRSTA